MIIQIRPGEPIPRPNWTEVEAVEVLGHFDRETMGPFIVDALDNDVPLHVPDPEVMRAIDRFLS